MPKFYSTKKPLSASSSRRRSFQKTRSSKKAATKTEDLLPSAKKATKPEKAPISSTSVKKEATPKAAKTHQPEPAPTKQSKPTPKPKEVEKTPYVEDYQERLMSEAQPHEQEVLVADTAPAKSGDSQLDEINRLIEQATSRLQELEEVKAEAEKEPEPVVEDPVAFDGVSSEDERMELVEAELSAARKRVRQLEHQLETVKADLLEEKKALEEEVKELRKEMHRTAPINDHSFFSFSKEIKEAVKALEDFDMANLEKMQGNSVARPTMKKDTAVPVKKVTKEPETPPEEDKSDDKKKVAETESKEEGKKKKKGKKKKMLITGGAAVLLLFAVSGVLSSKLIGKSSVNEDLVNEYLQNSGSVAGASDEVQAKESPDTPSPQQQAASANKKAREEEYQESQADVSYSDTQWHELEEPTFGIAIKYPVNAVNVIKTDSSMTFIRKNGYIFKVQKIETALELSEYWKQIKATSLSYDVEERTFKGEDALFLQLQEKTQYPGNRYLVKKDDFIYDVWYATESSAFDSDELKRVNEMLDSFSFIEQ